MSTFAITLATLRADHIAALNAIAANPRHLLQPQMRDLLRRLGLIVPTEPPRAARKEKKRMRPPPGRAHAVTELGERVRRASRPGTNSQQLPSSLVGE